MTSLRLTNEEMRREFLMRWDALREDARAARADWPLTDSVALLHQQIQSIAQEANINLLTLPSPIPFWRMRFMTAFPWPTAMPSPMEAEDSV